MCRCQCGVAAKIHFNGRGEPAQAVPLAVCWRLHCRFCDWPRDAPQVVKDVWRCQSQEANFCKAKAKECGARNRSAPYKNGIKEQIMEYLIVVAVVATMALYALIIIGCLKQPEW